MSDSSPRRKPGSSVGSAWIPAFAGMTGEGLNIAPPKLDSFATYFVLQATLAGRYAFSDKARMEMETVGLTESDVAESIITAVAIYKRLRSPSPFRSRRLEYLYVIQSTTFDGVMVHSKGKLITEGGRGQILLPRLLQEGSVMAQGTRAFHVSACPTCGSTRIRMVRSNWSGAFKRKRYVVNDLRYFHCPRCDEKVSDPEAMRRIQAASPAFSRTRGVRKTASGLNQALQRSGCAGR